MKTRRQMSESIWITLFLTVSGGLQDAYTYWMRGGVFANGQTGNVVLMSGHLFAGDWAEVLRYLVPIMAFAFGVLAAEQLHGRGQRLQKLHWRQYIALAEILMLFVAGCLPSAANLAANALVSCACAMQLQTFRKVNGYGYASTMCVGNLRCGVEAASAYLRTRDRALLKKAEHYGSVLLFFVLGAALGTFLSARLQLKTIWVSCALLLVSFFLMFVGESGSKDR